MALSVYFLGTASGGGPSQSRNCSSLVAEVLGNSTLWMVDCAEGTLRQFEIQPQPYYLRPKNVTKILITHMHADHCMGIITFLRHILHPPPATAETKWPSSTLPRIEIYGPAGIRIFVRSIMKMTLTKTSDKYVVHELLTADDVVTPCDPPDVLHPSERPGHDIRCSKDGFWRGFTKGTGSFGEVIVDACPILHRDPCLGYVIYEATAPSRKIVILGDTYDPAAIIPIATNPAPSLLIHEATDAHIPRNVDPKAHCKPETVREVALARGHSTPEVAGAFARRVGAQKLVLNHIGSRFPAPASFNSRGVRGAVMREIERQASKAWGMGEAVAAWDFMHVAIPVPSAQAPSASAHREAIDVVHADPAEGIVYRNQAESSRKRARVAEGYRP